MKWLRRINAEDVQNALHARLIERAQFELASEEAATVADAYEEADRAAFRLIHGAWVLWAMSLAMRETIASEDSYAKAMEALAETIAQCDWWDEEAFYGVWDAMLADSLEILQSKTQIARAFIAAEKAGITVLLQPDAGFLIGMQIALFRLLQDTKMAVNETTYRPG